MRSMGMMHSKWWKEKPTTKNTLPSNVIIQIGRRDKYFSRQIKAEIVKNHYIGFISNGKGTLSRGGKATTKMGEISLVKKKKKKHIK